MPLSLFQLLFLSPEQMEDLGIFECSHCHGYGSSLKEDDETCTKCKGAGLVRNNQEVDCRICQNNIVFGGECSVDDDEAKNPCPNFASIVVYNQKSKLQQSKSGENMEPKIVKGEELQLRDVVRSPLSKGPYIDATVIKIDPDNKMVHLLRPRVVCGDFSYTGGVLHSLGFEQYQIWFNTEMELLDRPNDKTPIR